METVKVLDVTKNERGWYEVALEGDDRKLSTKDRPLADALNASIGGTIGVDVNESVNGKFTNYFVNAVDGVENGAKPAPKKPAAEKKPVKEIQETRDEPKLDIDASWAFGQSVSLLIASDAAFTFPLDAETMGKLELTADTLLQAKHKLAGR